LTNLYYSERARAATCIRDSIHESAAPRTCA